MARERPQKTKVERTINKHFTCSAEESRQIEERAKREKKTVSAYLRDAALLRNEPVLPVEAWEILKRMEQNELKVGININQMARLGNTEGHVGAEDYERALKLLSAMLDLRKELLSILKRMAVREDGDHEAAPA